MTDATPATFERAGPSGAADFIPFALPDVGEAEIGAVSDAIRSGWLSSGPRVELFEEAFAARIGPGVHAVAVSSATAGLHLALEAAGIGPGQEVLVPTWTFTATAEVVRYLGAIPVLVDVDRTTLLMDLDDAQSKITPRTVAVMPVHLAGRMMSPSIVENFADRNGLAVVEDAAHAFPALSEGVFVGSGRSAATVFSFYATKTITTGEGGMVVTRDPDLARRVRVMRLHGIDRNAFDRYRSTTPAWQYDVVAAGYKYNLADPAAAMGLVQLGRADDMRQRREWIASTYCEAFADLPLELPGTVDQRDLHAWHLFIARTGTGTDRDDLVRRLAEAGIGTSVHFIPLHLQPVWKEFGGLRPEDFPVATAEYERVLSLPIYSAMTDAQVHRVANATRAIVR